MHAKQRLGFTLVELLVVIAIIGVLVGLLLPAVQAAREAARRAQCLNNLKNLGLAVLQFEGATGNLPPGRNGCDSTQCTPNSSRRGASGFLTLLPQLEQPALYDSIDFADGPWRVPANAPERNTLTPHLTNQQVIETSLQIMNCPSDSKEPFVEFKSIDEATSSYALCSGTHGPSDGILDVVKYTNDGSFMYLRGTERTGIALRQVTDGTSHTIFIGETRDGHLEPTRNRWTAASRHVDGLRTTDNPMNTEVGTGWAELTLYGYSTTGSFASRHPGGAQFVFGDGHAAFIDENISLQLYRALSTRSNDDNLDSE